MKKLLSVLLLPLILFAASCKSTDVNDKTETEEQNPEEIFEEPEFSFEEEYYKDVTWTDIYSLKDLEGRWETPEGILQFPYELKHIILNLIELLNQEGIQYC